MHLGFVFTYILPAMTSACLNNRPPSAFTTPVSNYLTRFESGCCDFPPEHPSGPVPGGYIVALRKGYTIEEHIIATSVDMQRYIHRIFDWDEIRYSTRDFPKVLIDDLRMDSGIEEVECNCYIGLDSFEG